MYLFLAVMYYNHLISFGCSAIRVVLGRFCSYLIDLDVVQLRIYDVSSGELFWPDSRL